MLKALADYYDCLCRQKDSGLVPDGYSQLSINYMIVLSQDGELKEILPYTDEIIIGKKTRQVGRNEIFPFRQSSPAINAETIEHRGKYLFGIDWDKQTGKLVINKNSRLAFEKCKATNLQFLDELNSPVVIAYKNFLQNWNIQQEIDNPILTKLDKNYDTAKYVIAQEDDLQSTLNNDKQVIDKWERLLDCAEISEEAVVGLCSISGKVTQIARIHNNLTGITGGLATGINIVCCKNDAFCSYGKTQSYNSSVSEEVMKKYTKAFNYLTSHNKDHAKQLDDMTLLFWAETTQREEPYLEAFMFESFGDQEVPIDMQEQLQSVFEQLAKGCEADWQSVSINEATNFYLLGVKPNSSRLAIKLFEHNSFGKLMNNIARHHRDMQLTLDDKQMPIWAIVNALKSPIKGANSAKSSDNGANADLYVKLIKSVLTGEIYPQYMFDTVIRRIKTDQDNAKMKFDRVNKSRVRIIKAYFSRNKNIGGLNMLNEESADSAYNCGRLFATLEKIQQDALPGLNATIKDKFFSSACSTPYLVLPRLLKLSQAHLKKISSQGLIVFYEKLLQEIIGKMGDSFPKALTMEKQGMFILGYYQQKQKFYEKRTVEGDIE
ncbi:MAG: type I-C CRISPR-associated protein Cas8c/Csd1 [Clostridia bacterium]